MKQVLIVLLSCAMAGVLMAMGITQEIPQGGVEGRATMEENGLPLAKALVVLTSTVQAYDEEGNKNWHTRTAADGTFSVKSIPAGTYTIEVLAQEHSIEDKAITVTEGKKANLDMRLKPHEHHFNLYVSQRVVAPNQAVKLQANGFVASSTLHLEVRQIKLTAIADAGGIEAALRPAYEDDKKVRHPEDFSDPIWKGDEVLDDKDAEGAFSKHLQLPALKEGLYYVSGAVGTLSDAVFLNVTRLAMVTKSSGDKALCYVVDIDTGAPIAGAPISLAKSDGLEKLGITGSDGLLNVDLKGHKAADKDNHRWVLAAQHDDSIAICDFYRRGTRGEDDGDASPIDPNTRVYAYADRPVYRPGDTISLKAIVRRREGNEYRLPKAGIARIEIHDAEEDLIATQTVPLTAHGTLDTTFKTSPEMPPGVYRFDVKAAGGEDSYYANLAAYRKPDYSIKVLPDKKQVVLGDRGTATVECQYFFGGPVVGAKVVANVYRSPEWEGYYGEDDEGAAPASDEGDDSGGGSFAGGEFVQKVEGTTDGAGRVQIGFPTRAADKDDELFSDYRYSIQAEVQESEGKSFEGRGSILVTRGSFDLRAETDPYIASPGDQVTLTVTTTSHDSPAKPVAGRSVAIEVGQETWTGHAVVFEPTQNLTAITGADGTAKVPLSTAVSGSLRIRTSAQDEGGRTVRAEAFLYVEGGVAQQDEAGPSLSIRPDRKQYKVGDTAKVLVSTSSPGGSALLTVQSDGIHFSRSVSLVKGTQIVRLPITKGMAPNAFIAVAYVHQRKFMESTHRLVVNRPDRHLTVKVHTDKPNVLPGSRVAFHISTTDEHGRGVPADVSLGVVDESIYTIKEDTTDVVDGMYPMQEDLVETTYSFPEIYLDGGDKAGGSVPIRSKFEDTAAWSPEVETDSTGKATVSIQLPDNLTSWRATVVAASDSTAVGMTTANVRASKPLMVRMQCPQFMVAADHQRLTAAITNDTGREQDVNIRLQMTGLSEEGNPPGNVHIGIGQTESVPVDVTAPASGEADVTAQVWSGDASDGVKSKFPILPHGRLVTYESSGSAGPSTTVHFYALPNRDRNTGELTVTITPSVLSGLFQSLDELVQFPYGCVEQTMSRFMPAILVTDAIKNTPFRRVDLETRTRKIADDGFARLAKMQHSDGAWGWWTYDESDPFMTAWVLDGLKRLQRAGYELPPYLNPEKAVKWGSERLAKPFKDDSLSARLFLAYALAEYGEKEAALAAIRGAKLAQANSAELSLAALGARTAGDQALADECLTNMKDRLDTPVDRKHWFEEFWSEHERLAMALAALTEIHPQDPLVPDLVAKLMKSRSCYGWMSTRESSLAIVGLTNFIRLNPAVTQPSSLRVSLNGRELENLTVNPADFDSPKLTLRVPVAQLTDGANELTLAAQGGAPYYSVELRQFDVQKNLPRILDSSGLSVDRHYYLMEARTMEDGTMKLVRSAKPIEEAKSGDVIRCVVTLQCAHPVEYLMVEDPIPSNCHVTDREDPMDAESWDFWWSSLVIRDDRVSMFSRWLGAGTHELEYTMRAEETGASSAMPTTAMNMYQPSEISSGGETPMEVHP